MAKQYKMTPLRRLVNAIVKRSVIIGVARKRTQLLTVKGRKSEIPRETPVNLVLRQSGRYLVAPDGERSWIKNARVAGRVTLRHGRGSEECGVEPVGGDDAASVLHQYWQENAITRAFFAATRDATDEDFVREVGTQPVFRLRRIEEGRRN